MTDRHGDEDSHGPTYAEELDRLVEDVEQRLKSHYAAEAELEESLETLRDEVDGHLSDESAEPWEQAIEYTEAYLEEIRERRKKLEGMYEPLIDRKER